MSANKHNLLLLFDRPNEPVFLEKGKENTLFEVPSSLLSDRYKDNPEIQEMVVERLGESNTVRIPVRTNNISIPNLRVPMSLDRKAQFSLLLPYHRKLANHLIEIFMGKVIVFFREINYYTILIFFSFDLFFRSITIGLRSVDDLQTVAVYARDRINPLMFNYALSVAILHRPDTKNLELPLLYQTFPDKFIDSKVIGRAREEASVVPEGQRRPIMIPKDYTASDLEPEHRLWYFREDIGLNIHHWHWHLVFAFDGPDEIVRKDRRGELFYYMHQQVCRHLRFFSSERFISQL